MNFRDSRFCFFDEFLKGHTIAVISNVTRRELEGAPESIKKSLQTIPKENLEEVLLTDEAENLAKNYIDEQVCEF